MMMPTNWASEGSIQSGLRFRRSKTSYTMDGFCLPHLPMIHLMRSGDVETNPRPNSIYLPLILLMRSGDVESNPGPNPIGSIEWERELVQLAERIDPAYYIKIGLSLGVCYAQLQTIMKEQLNNNTNALMAVFMTWNNRQLPGINKQDFLADKLQQNGLDYLSFQIRNGNLDANFTEEPPRSLEPRNEPLSPALIERCRGDFKFKYRSSLCQIRSNPLDPNSVVKYMYMYTDLVLKEEHYKGGTSERKLLTYSEFVNLTVNEEHPRRLMVQGEAGAGKTTFCAKIAWDWINGKYFQEFVWVLVLPLRECKRYTLGEIAKSYLTKSNPTTAHQLTEYIRSNPDKVFIACDGLDEFSGNAEQLSTEGQQTQSVDQLQLQSMQSTSGSSLPRVANPGACENPLRSCEIQMTDILRSEQLETCPVLVTSRPWKAKQIGSNSDLAKLYTFIHVEGFSEDGLSDYIHKFFPDNDARANHLIKLTEDSDVISGNMVHYPLYVAILCLMWREISDQKVKEMESFETFSQVFRQMFHFLKEHFAQKEIKNVASQPLRAYLKEINNLLEPVSKLALTGLLENKLVFDESNFQHCPKSLEIACRVGIMSQENKISSMLDRDESSSSYLQTRVFFPHKLFQEYMAGMHLASICRSDCDEFKRLMEKVVLPRGEEFRYLLYFAASQDKEVGINVMKCMVQELNERTDLLVDVAFECHHPEAVAVVQEKIPPMKQKMMMYDMTSHTIAAYLSIGIDVVNLHTMRDCNQNDSHNVARIICSSPSLRSLHIKGYFHDDFLKILHEQGAQIQAQTVRVIRFGSLESGTCGNVSLQLAETLASMPNLIDLHVTLESTCDEFSLVLYSVLKEKAPILKIQKLTLATSHVKTPGDEGFSLEFNTYQSLSSRPNDLAEALSSMPELTDLTLHIPLHDTLYQRMNQRASSSCESFFPQVASGNFIFNGDRQTDMQQFVDTLQLYERPIFPSWEENCLGWLAHLSNHGMLSDEDLSEEDQDVHSDDILPPFQQSIGVAEEAQSTSTELPCVNDPGSTCTCIGVAGVAEEAQSPSTELPGVNDPAAETKGPLYPDPVQDHSFKRKVQSTATSEASSEKRMRVGSSDQETSSYVHLCDYPSSDESTSPEASLEMGDPSA